MRRRQSLGEILPGNQDEVLVHEEFLEFGTADKVEIVLTPLCAPIGMVESGTLNFGVVVSEVDDKLIGTRGEGGQDFFVGGAPFRGWCAGAEAEKLIEDDWVVLDEGREIGGGLPIATNEERREFVGFGGSEIRFGEVGSADDGAHVGVEVRDVDAGSEGFVDLGVRFGENIGHFGAGVDVFGEEGKVAVGVEQAGIFGLR